MKDPFPPPLVLKLQRLPLRAPCGLGCPARAALLVGLDREEVPDLLVECSFFEEGCEKRTRSLSLLAAASANSSSSLTLSIIPRLLALLPIFTVRSRLRRPRPSVTTALCDSRTPARPRRSVTNSERMAGGGVDPGIVFCLFFPFASGETALSVAPEQRPMRF